MFLVTIQPQCYFLHFPRVSFSVACKESKQFFVTLQPQDLFAFCHGKRFKTTRVCTISVMMISKYETSNIPEETFAPFDGGVTHSLKEFLFIDHIANKVKNQYIKKPICSSFLPFKNNHCFNFTSDFLSLQI